MLMLILTYVAIVLIDFSNCGKAPTWDACNCRLDDWKSWSSCTATCGGGYQRRSRSVFTKCNNFTDCASNDMGFDYRSCAKTCTHGQFHLYTFSSYLGSCNCEKGWKGKCCDQAVNCGTPSKISNGMYIGNKFTFNNRVTYKCDKDYNMTNPLLAVRVCSEYGYWSGSLPQCSYAMSCNSNPCMNGATCTNSLDDFTCTCQTGWTGKKCEMDIQPPVVSNCSNDRYTFTSNITSLQSWTEPVFTDPRGLDVIVSRNYQNNSFEFPWGGFTIQYSAVKPSNGLSEECTFNISVKPFPCVELDVPKNGYMLCNGWKMDYARVCKLLCYSGFDYPPGYKPEDWYTCGSSGNWLPSGSLTSCVPDDMPYMTSFTSVTDVNISNCSIPESNIAASEFYIRSLKKSQFNELCDAKLGDCGSSNVYIKCDAS